MRLHGKDLGAFSTGGQGELAPGNGERRGREHGQSLHLVQKNVQHRLRLARKAMALRGGSHQGQAVRLHAKRANAAMFERRQHLAQGFPPAGRDACDGDLVPLALDHVDAEFIDADGGRVQRPLQQGLGGRIGAHVLQRPGDEKEPRGRQPHGNRRPAALAAAQQRPQQAL